MHSAEQQLAHENLYRDSSTLLYGDNKPSEEAIDRVVSKINKEYVLNFVLHSKFIMSSYSIDQRGKFSRKRLNEAEGDITYINEQNRVFNKKVRSCSCSWVVDTNPPVDRSLLWQVHCGDPCKFRTRDCSVVLSTSRPHIYFVRLPRVIIYYFCIEPLMRNLYAQGNFLFSPLLFDSKKPESNRRCNDQWRLERKFIPFCAIE